MSDAVTANVTLAPLGPAASAVIGAGTLTVGGVVSATVTVNEPAAVPLAASTQSTVVVPRWNVNPEAGVQLRPSAM